MAVPFYNQADQAIWESGNKFIPQEQYRLNYTPSQKLASTVGIPNTEAAYPYIYSSQGGGGGGGGGGGASLGAYTGREYNPESYITNRGYLSGDYIQGTEPQPNKLQKFGQMVGAGIMNFVPGMKFIRGLDKFNTLSPADQEFARQQMSFGEQSIHGGNLSNQDRYGYNKRSLMGNYANVIAKRVDIANKRKAEGKELRDIDQYYLDKEEEKNTLTNQMKFNDFIRQRQAANKFRELEAKGIKTYPSGQDIHGGAKETITPAQQVQQNIQTYGNQDRPSEGMNAPGSGKGQSPTGGDVSGTPFKKGGRIGYNRGRVVNPGGYQGDEEFVDENTLEFMRDQGIPHSEMAETSPFEMRINELMDEGLSWQEAYEIASQEFGQVAEGESDQGIASII